MHEETEVTIEQLDWLPLPNRLQDGLSRQPLAKRQLRTWSLVLQAKQIPCRSQREAHGWQLLVPATHYQQALDELLAYEQQNRNWPPPPPAEIPQQENTTSTIWVLIALGLFHILTQQKLNLFGHHPVDWYALGNAHAGKILDGQWWRLVTALTLHSGGVHLAGNLIVGGLFINRLCRDLGAGLGWSLVLLSGILGNLANAFVQNPDHRSIGASTAVFGAVGLLAAINTLRYRHSLQNRWPIPVAAGLGLLALLGAGGENTDIGAHLFGFLAGLGLAIGSKYLIFRPSTIIIVGISVFLLSSAWLAAFVSHHP